MTHYNPLQLLYLLRLARLLRLRTEHMGLLCPAWKWTLISKAEWSTYQDCVRLGLEEDANKLMEKARAGR